MRYIFPVLFLLLTACNTPSNAGNPDLNIKGLDWKHHKVVTLQSELNEISGIAYDRTTHEYLAINDEEGLLYVLNNTDYTIKQALPFAKKGDYECVSLGAGKVYILKSNGDIWSMSRDKGGLHEVNRYRYTGEPAEFEATLWDQNAGQLRVISKKSDLDRSEKATHIYTFDPVANQYIDGRVSLLPWADIRSKGAVIKGFHPSAAAVQPGTGYIFVLSSIEKLLVIYNSKWEVESVHQLDQQLFRQPEGIIFDEKGNLIITNEAADARPTLIFIPLKH